MNTLRKVIIALTLSSLCFAFTSNAGLITNWDYHIDSAFIFWDPTSGTNPPTGSLPNAHINPGTSATKIQWGSGNVGPSHIQITSGSNGHLNSSDSLIDSIDPIALNDITLVSQLTHQNNIINGSSTTLNTATLRTELSLDGGLGFQNLPTLDFGIKFLETSNSNCDFNAPHLDDCDDIFIITPPLGIIGTFDEILGQFTFSQLFTYDDWDYTVQLIVDGLLPLLPSDEDDPIQSACAKAGVPEGCIGFLTREATTNTFDVSINIISRGARISEPSGVLLMSLVLLGIVSSLRKKHF